MKILPRCYVFCLLLLVIAGTGGRKVLRPADKHSVSSLARTSIINQTEPLCRELLPEHTTLRFLTYPVPVFHKDGTVRHLWNVDCQDAQGNRLVYVLWDEDQHQLVQIGRSYYRTRRYTGVTPMPETRLSDMQAECAAREWVVRLHLTAGEEVQNCRKLLRRFANVVNVNFYLPSRSLRVAMADSGELRGVFVSNISEHSTSFPAVDAPIATPAHSEPTSPVNVTPARSAT